MSHYMPAPSGIFVGRDEQLRRAEQGLARVAIAVIYGVPGIGKSTLAFALAERWGRPGIYHRIAEGEPLSRLLDDVRRAVSRGPIPEIADDDERIADAAARLDAAHALLVVDNLQHLDLDDRLRLVLGIGQLLHRGRLVVTTRERLELSTAVDRLEIHLTGLDEASAHMLWAALDNLYQPSPGFELAWRQSQGNPLILRQAHRGRPAVDPCAAAVAAINRDERRVANLLALANVPLPTVGLAGLLPDERTCVALRGLHARLVVDIYPNKTCALHDLFRDEVQRTMSADERATAHTDLARLLVDADLDVVTRVREVCRHLREIDRFEEATQILVAHAADLIRHGAALDLFRGLEAIPRNRRSMIAQIIHARTLGRLMDLHGAFQTLEQLLEAGAEPRVEVLLGFGPVAMVTGRLAAAECAFAELLERPDLGAWQRVHVQFAFGLLRAYQGRGDDGRAFLRRAIADAASREAEGVLLAGEVYCFWLDEREAEATEPLRRAAALLRGSSRTVHGALLAPAVLVLALSRLGRFAEAEPWLHQLAALSTGSSDPRLHTFHKAVLANVDYERGARSQAMAGLAEAGDEAELGGDVIHALRARVYVARLLLIMGRRRQALAMLDEITARSRALGVLHVVQMVERSWGLDPVIQLRASTAAAEPTTKHGAIVRARCLSALHAARDGDDTRVAALLEANAALTTGGDYALDRVLGLLARAVLARGRGDNALARAARAEAQQEVQSGGVDPELLDELEAKIGHIRVMTGGRALVRPSYHEIASSTAIVLDGQKHELRIDGRIHALKRQAMLREILYALSAHQGHVVSKQEVARRLWRGQYDPAIHDNRLWANIHRLRLFLASSGLNIEFVDGGYRLAPGRDFVFVDPPT